jgi:hypothetical protein
LGDYLTNLVLEGDILINIMFNIGYIWQDIVMLSVGTPCNTVSSYAFYMSFYLGDLIFRFVFASEKEVNCWFPWNNCLTAAE